MTHEVKGMFILMIHQLLSEYNPETCEKIEKEIGLDAASMDPEGWYDFKQYFVEYVNKLSADAQMAIGKKIYPTLKAGSNMLDGIEDPKTMFTTIPAAYESQHRDKTGQYEIVESGDDFVKIRTTTGIPPDLDMGLFLGIPFLFKIIKVNHKYDIDTSTTPQTVNFDIKWQ